MNSSMLDPDSGEQLGDAPDVDCIKHGAVPLQFHPSTAVPGVAGTPLSHDSDNKVTALQTVLEPVMAAGGPEHAWPVPDVVTVAVVIPPPAIVTVPENTAMAVGEN